MYIVPTRLKMAVRKPLMIPVNAMDGEMKCLRHETPSQKEDVI